jgi:serine/threonine-protein kinase
MLAPPNPGETIAGKYLVERVLGSGGMGVVVAAKHLKLGERVAIKFLLPGALAHADLVGRFLREGRAAARLRSEHVTRIYDVGTLEDGGPYLVMEYLEGRDLGAVIDERGPLPCEVAVEYVLQACEGLAEAHAAGIVHRDLKPANLFLIRRPDHSPGIKIIDFGISKLVARSAGAEGGGQDITNSSVLMGSPRYMAPEQMVSARDADPRSDIWSLGAVLYHLITGTPPFDSESVVGVYEQIRKGPRSLRVVRPDAPSGLGAIITRCLKHDRAERFADVADLAAALVDFGPPHARSSADRVARILGSVESTARPDELLAPRGQKVEIALEAVAHAATHAGALGDVGVGPMLRKNAPGEPSRGRPRFLDATQGAPPEATPRAPGSSPRSPAPRGSDPSFGLPPARGADPALSSPPAPGVEGAVREALAGFGIGGAVVLKGKQIELHGRGAPVVIDVASLAEQWPLLPPALKRRKAGELARRLADAHRASQSSMTVSSGAAPASMKLLGRLFAAVVILAAVAVGLRLYINRMTQPPAPVGPRPETPDEQRQRLARVCEAMRSNIYKGASIGPYEVGGWVVELWLAKRQGPGPRESAAILGAIRDGKLTPAADDILAQVSDGTVTVEDGEGPSGVHDVKLVFGGGYARVFFDPGARPRFMALAERLADGAGAEAGALYGRCAHLSTHDVGAWFRGRDAGLVSAALLYGVGLFADPRVIDRAALARFKGKGDFGALAAAAAAAKLDVPALRGLVAEPGGSVATATSGAVSLSFPIGGPLRALRASRAVARKLGVGGE